MNYKEKLPISGIKVTIKPDQITKGDLLVFENKSVIDRYVDLAVKITKVGRRKCITGDEVKNLDMEDFHVIKKYIDLRISRLKLITKINNSVENLLNKIPLYE